MSQPVGSGRRSPNNVAQHPGEHHLVNPPQSIPVEQPPDPDGIEERGLPYEAAAVRRRHLKLKPCPPGDPHFGRESEQPAGLHRLDPPEIQCIPWHHRLRLPPAPPHPRSTDCEVEQATQAPESIPIVPARLPADASDGSESLVRCAVYPDRP